MNRGITLLEVIVIIIAIGILAAVLLPPVCGGRNRGLTSCANNLKQLYSMGTIYASQHRGQWPEETGGSLWLTFQKMEPPLIQADLKDLYFCPFKAEPGDLGQTDYRGPITNVNHSMPGDPIGADKVGNHGEQEGGCVLRKAGDVQALELGDPLWDLSQTHLKP
jgi:type II secretory pathway pseudopilin PulG